ncbi:MAG: hypothetical protein RL309_1657 [Verrucomicrobiota bacterium]
MTDEALLDGERDLGHDLEIGFRKQVEGVTDDAFGGVLDRDDAVGGFAGFDRGEDVADGAEGERRHARAEGADLGLLGEGTFWSEVGDGIGHLGADGKGDDFAVDRAESRGRNRWRGFGDRAEELFFALRSVDRRTRLQLRFADRTGHLQALTEQLEDLAVDTINLAAVLFEAHSAGFSSSGGASVAMAAED